MLDSFQPPRCSTPPSVGALSTITVCTSSLEKVRRFYGDGLGLTCQGPWTLPTVQRDFLSKSLGLARESNWQLYTMGRHGVGRTAHLRIIDMGESANEEQHSWSASELGPFAMGFPNRCQRALDTRLRQMGFQARNALESYEINRGESGGYGVEETIFMAPDGAHIVGIERRNGMSQLGEIHPDTDLGGPSYVSQVVSNTDTAIEFYSNILGLELRVDERWTSNGDESALAVPRGTEFRFSLLCAPGLNTQHILLLEYLNLKVVSDSEGLKKRTRGIINLSFRVDKLEDLFERLKGSNNRGVFMPNEYRCPVYGPIKSVFIRGPDDLSIEAWTPAETSSESKADQL